MDSDPIVNALASPDRLIQALFDRIAPVYDNLNDLLSFGLHRVWKQMAVKWSRATVGMPVLDLCCGSGDLSLRLARQVGGSGAVTGVDFAPQLLTIAAERARQAGLTITWVEANVLTLPFADEQFAAATMGYGLRNVVDIPACLREIYRVLQPGATVAVLDFNRPTNPQVAAFQAWYLQTVVVPAAQRLGFPEEYAYLQPSLDRFPAGEEQVKLAHLAGFQQAVHYPIASGTMGVLVATK